MRMCIVDIWPFRNNADDGSVEPIPDDLDFFKDGIGGHIDSTITLKAKNTPYIVVRSIYIRFVWWFNM